MPRLPPLLLAAALLGVVVGATPLGAQGAPGSPPPGLPRVQEQPSMPEAPRMFRIGATGSWLAWSEAAPEQNRIDDLFVAGVELEAVVARWLGVRLGVTTGSTRIRTPGGASTDARQYLVELLAAARLPVGPLSRAGIVPWAEAGVGTLVHHPSDTLRARNQNALVFGGGIDWDALERFGIRMGWRGMEVQQVDVLASQELDSRERWAHRVVAAVYWRF